ncbi:MAG: hypothetical protein GTN64_08630 [Candidatus Latescibacteria bacterium]|nr:hypothetical protein [Candidatus Latescibacterota bacterium]NIO78664.1 hypothetical protein [Candidatus Latescibacterota bacterium]
MRRISPLILMFTALVVTGVGAHAQVFYEYPGAPVIKENEPAIGPVIAVGEHDLFRILGYARFNVSQYADFGLELVFDNVGDDWRVGAGGDVKYAIVPESATMPFDLALNAGFGFESGDNVTQIQVPIGAVISRPLQLASGRFLVPYGGLYLLIVHTSIDIGPVGDISDTDADVELRIGTSIGVTDRADMFAALHIGSGTKFFIGLNWHL